MAFWLNPCIIIGVDDTIVPSAPIRKSCIVRVRMKNVLTVTEFLLLLQKKKCKLLVKILCSLIMVYGLHNCLTSNMSLKFPLQMMTSRKHTLINSVVKAIVSVFGLME